MKSFARIAAIALAPVLALTVAPAAYADGNVACRPGPQKDWKPIDQLKKKIWMEGWELIKLQTEGDCYEVYARNSGGQVLEAFFHPVTLEKLIVFRRGTEVYRKKGFSPN